MRPNAAAPKITRLLWWPVRPKGARSITRPTLAPGSGGVLGGATPAGREAPALDAGAACGLDERRTKRRRGALVVGRHGRRWRSTVGAVLVIGLLGGVALAALAGAR